MSKNRASKYVFATAAVDQAVQACQVLGLEFISLAPAVTSAWAYDTAAGTYHLVTYKVRGGVARSVQVDAEAMHRHYARRAASSVLDRYTVPSPHTFAVSGTGTYRLETGWNPAPRREWADYADADAAAALF